MKQQPSKCPIASISYNNTVRVFFLPVAICCIFSISSFAQETSDNISQSCSSSVEDFQPQRTRTFAQLTPLKASMKTCTDIRANLCATPKFPYIGVQFKFWEPVLIVETVRRPGDYVIEDSYGDIVPMKENSALLRKDACQQLRREFHVKDLKVSSMSSSQSLGASTLQFNEVHVYSYLLGVPYEFLCRSVPNMFPYYSERDAVHWRTGKSKILGVQELNLALPIMGSWGRLLPRTGFMNHVSPLVASAASVIKAVDIAHPEYGLRATGELTLLRDKVQMVYPRKSRCIPIGMSLRSWENKIHSKDGRYVWIYWHYKECPCRTITG